MSAGGVKTLFWSIVGPLSRPLSWCGVWCPVLHPAARVEAWGRKARRGERSRTGGSETSGAQNLGKLIRGPQFPLHAILYSYTPLMIRDGGKGGLHSSTAPALRKSYFWLAPSPRSRGSCITKPHRKGTSKPPLGHTEVLVLGTCPACLALSNYEVQRSDGAGCWCEPSSWVARRRPPSGRWSGWDQDCHQAEDSRGTEGARGIRGQFRPRHHVPNFDYGRTCANPPTPMPGEEN